MSESTGSLDLVPELSAYYHAVLNINRDAEDLVRGLTDAQLQWKPAPHVWSIAQCLDHLVASGRTELPSIRRAISQGRPRESGRRGPNWPGLLGWLAVRAMGPSARLKFKAPRAYLPANEKKPSEVIRDFFLVQEGVLQCIRNANGLDLAGTSVPVLHYNYVRLSLGQDLKLFVVHEQRHILQAQRIKNALPRI